MPEVAIQVRPLSLGMVTLRGGPEVMAVALRAAGLPGMPERRMSAAAGEVSALWMSPDEAMLTCSRAEAAGLALRMAEAIGDAHGTAIDMSAARQVYELTGPGVRVVLSGLMPVDFDRLAPEEVRRTRMGQIPVALWRYGQGWRLMCFRSVAGYAADLLRIGAGLEAEAARG